MAAAITKVRAERDGDSYRRQSIHRDGSTTP
jgi:hypothetical protein